MCRPPACRSRTRTMPGQTVRIDRKSTRLNSSHLGISYAVFCLKKKKTMNNSDAVNSKGSIAGTNIACYERLTSVLVSHVTDIDTRLEREMDSRAQRTNYAAATQ